MKTDKERIHKTLDNTVIACYKSGLVVSAKDAIEDYKLEGVDNLVCGLLKDVEKARKEERKWIKKRIEKELLVDDFMVTYHIDKNEWDAFWADLEK